MSAKRASIVCDRAREQISLRLDCEPSQLEARMLDAHLARCADCSAYAAQLEAITILLRAAPQEPLERPVAVRRERALSTARLQVGVAAALALAALGLGTQLAGSGAGGDPLARFEGKPNLSPPFSVLEREQAIITVVSPGRPLPPRGSLL